MSILSENPLYNSSFVQPFLIPMGQLRWSWSRIFMVAGDREAKNIKTCSDAKFLWKKHWMTSSTAEMHTVVFSTLLLLISDAHISINWSTYIFAWRKPVLPRYEWRHPECFQKAISPVLLDVETWCFDASHYRFFIC